MTTGAGDPHLATLEAAALDLYAQHRVVARRAREIPLLARLEAMPAWLVEARARLASPEPVLAKAADWLLDNDYLVERAVRQIRQDLPSGFYGRLPRLVSSEAEGLPRVFSIAHGLLHATHLQLSLDAAVRFVDAYQGAGEALTIAELWAFPALLRTACLELLTASLARSILALPAPAAATLPALAPTGLDDTDCVARALANLRVIDAISWKDFFTRTSRVEAALAGDPAGVYPRMDFETCDRYRRAVEALALASGRPEPEVAECVVKHARSMQEGERALDHVGTWLIGEGAPELAGALGCRPRARERLVAWAQRRAEVLYAAALALATGAAMVVPALYLYVAGAGPLALIAGIAVTLLPASVVSFTLVHWGLTLCVVPRPLPKLDFSKGIAPDCRCAVVIPALASSAREARELVAQLEEHYLASSDPALEFALLTDWADAPAERMPEDEAIVAALCDGIRELGARYGRGGRHPFHLLHRPRRWNPAEGCWMGWERKRGKLAELNQLLEGRSSRAFSVREGSDERLAGIRFVVTLDADTRLPPGSVARLVGTLAHPLNRARFDERGRVSRGYTVVQPRVEIAPEAGDRSWFARLYAGDTAIDIYTRAVSDVYQDVFGSGTFVGKGVYEVASFERSLAGRVPENALASHDLLEGAHGRVALASDIVLYEGFPSRYVAFARRWHRWVRGDWQLLPWLGRNVPGPDGARLANRLSLLDRWKILDNLRRSLLPPALVLLLVAGWLVLPGEPWVWTALGLAAPAAYLFTDLVTGLSRGRRRGVVRSSLRAAADHAGRWALSVTFLAQDAVLAADAIVRTLWRLAVSRRGLLEWTSAADVEARLGGRGVRWHTWRRLATGPLSALAAGLAVAALRPRALPAAAAVLVLWALSPEIAHRIARPRGKGAESLGPEETRFLRRLARRTWLFFETFVGPEDHWLPPDNVQEHPHYEVAHRTSPTNVGMALLSTLAAADFGYLASSELVVRVRNTLETLGRVPRYRGHVLNWIDTRSLEPLEPRFVSTVDSGNLAVSLVTLEQGCLELARGCALRPQLWDGLLDGLALLGDALARVGQPAAAQTRVAAMEACARAARAAPERRRAALTQLSEVDRPALDAALAEAGDRESAPAAALRELRIWLERTHHHLHAMQRELEELAPWWKLLDAPPPACEPLARTLRTLLPPELLLAELESRCSGAAEQLASVAGALRADPDAERWTHDLRAALEKGGTAGAALRQGLRAIAADAGALAWGMDFAWLYDPDTRRLRIGYNASADRADPNHYDLLASEARLASFFAIAKGDAPLEHWFHLGRPITRAEGGLVLVSWGGSMFEYLMPPLLLRSQSGTLLAQSERAAVDTQRRWAARLGIPWGASESAFASLDPGGRYRYQSFGVPGLGLRRGLARDRVVAPYASALALPIRARAAAQNLRALDALALGGHFGLFEAADFTPERISPGRRHVPVRCYMAHHQGMILAALDNALHGDVLVQRFHADLRMRATELLLHERIPSELPTDSSRGPLELAVPAADSGAPPLHSWAPAGIPDAPRVHLLGNGRLCSWISTTGSGAVGWHGQAVTRFRPDATRDDSGVWLYVRDEADAAIWSVCRQPAGVAAEESTVRFHAHVAEFHRRDRGIAIRMEVFVPPGDDLEVRRVSVANESDRPRVLSLTSYGEIVLAPPLEDERHPAFSKLFVGAEWLPEVDGLLFTRRPRHPREQPPVVMHRVIAGKSERSRCTGFEADRAAFLGRGGDPRRPRGVREGLADTAGYTLDPVMALQVRIELEPDERCELAFLTFAGGSRESVLEAAGRYTTLAALDWARADAAAEAAREAQRLSLDAGQLPELQALASLLLHPHGALAAAPERRAANRLGQSRLWGLGLSGDLPILLVRCSEAAGSTLLEQAVRGHRLWRRRGLDVDLVVLRSGLSAYVEPLRERLFTILRAAGEPDALGGRGGIHLLFADQLPDDERCLLECAARVVLDDTRGSLAEQLEAAPPPPLLPPQFQPTAPPASAPGAAAPLPAGDLLFDNGLGGFTSDGREYVIHLDAGASTPAPWCNVLANDGFGSVVTESGGGFTWCGNSGENRLTPWTNDPVMDPPSEALYLRDEQSGEVWTPTPRPAGRGACEIRHGPGYSRWHSVEQELEAELLVFVPADAPVKIARLRLRNRLERPRRVTATYWAEWLLGALASVSRSHVVAQWEPGGPALFARNPWSADFAERVAFLTATAPPHGVTADRREFLGREGSAADPAALRRWGLSGRAELGIDACAAYQVHLDLAPGADAELSFVIGQGRDRGHALELVATWRDAARIESAFVELGRLWEHRLGAVQVRTPDAGLDLLVNGWLLHQTLSSRVLARAGFYQAGGAIGFRDQLQDVLALLHSEPERVRSHLLACAAHQFEEGDVLHWWHPPADRGVRTRCSDDLLWLPWAASQYVEATGDASILAEEVAFLHAPPLAVEEVDRYARFEAGREKRSFLEHCERALERGVTRGPHGLPRIGTGDWNDGFDRVGARGSGESVWLGWFAVAAMRGFSGLCERCGEADLARRWEGRAAALAARVDETAWDGDWYVRAFDDDGRAFGSKSSDECRIDSIAQSWAVLSGGAPDARARHAVASARRELVREEERLVRLLWPPFDVTPRDPGYVKAYPPGVRENGGQYTHAAAWLAWAFAALGDGDEAHRLFTLMSPLSHTADGAALARYRVEPYVIAADVAAVPPHVGRGGWSWYTGSAGWIWRLAVEAILGLRLREGQLELRPCLPGHWSGFAADLRGPDGALAIRVSVDPQAPAGLHELSVDGVLREEPRVAFPANGTTRRVELRIGRGESAQAQPASQATAAK